MGTAVDAAAFGSVDGVVGEVMRLHRSLPARPSLEEVEAAEALAHAADREERARLDAVSRLRRPPAVPDELFGVALEMHRALAAFQCREQKRDATRLLELDALHALADEEKERVDAREVMGDMSLERLRLGQAWPTGDGRFLRFHGARPRGQFGLL